MFELNLKREYNAYWVIGAINRALGDKWNEKRPYTCPKIISMSSEKIEIIGCKHSSSLSFTRINEYRERGSALSVVLGSSQ